MKVPADRKGRPNAERVTAEDKPHAFFYLLLSVIITALVFLPTLRNGFVWDDYENLLLNKAFRGLGPDNLRWIFTNFHLGLYQPVSWLSYAVDYSLWGLNPLGYHLTNLLFHCANAAIFFWVAKELLAAANEGASRRIVELSAFAAALFFAIHPMRTESVAWATERRDVLSGFFSLLALLLYLRYARTADRGRLRLAWGAFALAAFSKPIVVGLPVCLLILDWYPLGRLESRTSLKGMLVEKAPFFLVSFVAAGIAPIAMASAHNLVPLDQFGLLERLAATCFSFAFYIAKTFVPTTVLPLYLRPEPLIPASPMMVASAVFVALTSVTALAWRERRPALLAAWAAYLLLILPVSGLVQNGPQLVAARYSYLSCLPWALLFGASLLFAARWEQQAFRVAAGAAFLFLAGASVVTFKELPPWRDELALWRSVVARAPSNYFAHYNLAKALQDKGEVVAALDHYREAARINPRKKDIFSNMGMLLAQQGDFDGALAGFEAALALDPTDSAILNNTGNLLAGHGRLADAVGFFQRAFESAPGERNIAMNLGSSSFQLGVASFQRKDLPSAVRYFRTSVDAVPDNPQAVYNLAATLSLIGRYEESAAWYQKLADMQPGNAQAHYELARVLRAMGRTAEAEDQLRIARRISSSRQ